MTERVYAQLKPTAYAEDYGRVAFKIPTEAKVYQFARDERGLITDRVLVAI